MNLVSNPILQQPLHQIFNMIYVVYPACFKCICVYYVFTVATMFETTMAEAKVVCINKKHVIDSAKKMILILTNILNGNYKNCLF